MKMGLDESAKIIDPRQPAQSAQADVDRNFSLSLNFLLVKGLFYIMTQSVVGQNGGLFYGSIIRWWFVWCMDHGDTFNPILHIYSI